MWHGKAAYTRDGRHITGLYEMDDQKMGSTMRYGWYDIARHGALWYKRYGGNVVNKTSEYIDEPFQKTGEFHMTFRVVSARISNIIPNKHLAQPQTSQTLIAVRAMFAQ